MPSKIKEEKVNSLLKDLKSHDFLVLTSFSNLKVKEVDDLRNKLGNVGVKYFVVKNRLAKIALKEAGYEDLLKYLTGSTAIALEKENINSAKIISDFSKEKGNLNFKAGLYAGKVITDEDLEKLAKLPSKEIILSQLLSLIKAPIQNLVDVLQAPIRDFLLVLQAIKDKKEEVKKIGTNIE